LTSEGARPDQIRPLSAWETFSGEVIDALKTPFVCGLFELDFAAAHALRSRLRDRGEEVSDTTVVLAAVGRVLAADPTLHTIHHRGRCIVPGSVDIGVSVGGHGPLAPVTVVRSVEGKGVLQIQREVRAGSREALRAEKRDIERAWACASSSARPRRGGGWSARSRSRAWTPMRSTSPSLRWRPPPCSWSVARNRGR
jgi:hypothetical protein